jgi:pyruvate/2-oxoglutarate dehydrogenase complex dihydrolipoamide acyltransferase (E2) component
MSFESKILAALVLVVVATGCEKKSEPEAATTPSASAAAPAAKSAAPTATAPAAAASTTAAAAAAAPAALALAGTCTTKAGARVLGCTEYYGKLPDKVEDNCKKDEGTFVAGATRCSTVDAIGQCAPKEPGATASETEVSYKTSVGDAKGSCEALGKTWTPLGADKK